MRHPGFTPTYIAKWFIDERKTMETEYNEIQRLKHVNPDDPDVLAREAKFEAHKQKMQHELRELPLPHLRMYVKHLKKHGIWDQMRRKYGPEFDKKHRAAFVICGLNPDEPPAPAPA
jgi:hypothetical protein